ncbi:MAG: hypothetical protein JWO09_2898 [Bacteroidetes bacterium]|nr:hypothetical protein [Bacteroidota bacterium]
MSDEIKSKRKLSKAKLAGIIGVTAGILSILGGLEVFYLKMTTKDFSGQWKITCNIKTSTYQPYIGKSSGWKVFFTQNGDKLNGRGEMTWIDDKEIPFSQHSPITMEGIVDGDEITLNYTMQAKEDFHTARSSSQWIRMY